MKTKKKCDFSLKTTLKLYILKNRKNEKLVKNNKYTWIVNENTNYFRTEF